jgi:type IV secretion system protein VirD4
MKEINLAKKDPLILSISIFFFSLFAGAFTATEHMAYRFQFSPLLGKSYWHLYNPVDFWFWFKKYSPLYPQARSMMLNSMLDGSLVFVIMLLVLTFIRGKVLGKVKAPDELSHFADKSEMAKMGLLEEKARLKIGPVKLFKKYSEKEKGIYIGRYAEIAKHAKNKTFEAYLKFDSNTHILYFAPTRSGKGVGFVIPNLLTYTSSMIVNDLKGENYELTAGYRAKMGQKIYYFNPTDMKSHVYNPLEFVRADSKEAVKDAQTVANIIVSDPMGSSASSSHWDNTARALLTGLILYVTHNFTPEDPMRSIGGIYKLMSDPQRPQVQTLDYIRQNAKHEMAARAAAIILSKEDAERSGIISTMTRFLELWADPLVDAVTRGKSSFSIEHLRKEPSTLYMATPTSDIDRTKPLIRIMLTQFMNLLGERLPKKEELGKPGALEILFMLDEFPRLGKIEAIEGALPIIAGYGVKLALITQDLNQLNKAYTKENEIMANAQLKVTYAASDPETAERISKYLGETVILRQGVSMSGKRFGSMLNQTSYSTNEQERTLMTPGQLQQLPFEQEIIILTGFPPVKAEKIFYFKEPFFKGKFGLPVPDTGILHDINLGIRDLNLPMPADAGKEPEKDEEADIALRTMMSLEDLGS